MAQITYAKLNLKPDFNKVEKLELKDGSIIEVKQFLSTKNKLDCLTNIINNSTDDNGFYNTARIDFNIKMELLFAYTNIKFTEKQLSDTMKIYDTLVASGIFHDIYNLIPEEDRSWFEYHSYASIQSIMKYRNSIYGILDAISTDYNNLNLDVDKLRDVLAKDENIHSLKDIVDKMV